jgi:phospholipid transport system substrate-binding protein
VRLTALVSTLALLLPSAPVGAQEPAPSATAREAAGPREVVESLHDVLLGCMKEADTLRFQGRYDRILAELDRGFDLPFMAGISIGATWKELSPRERADFVELSRRLSASNYAHNFDGYGGQRFETLSDEPAARGTIVVKTELVQPEGDDVRFDYRLRKLGDTWRVIDVQLDGKISEITLRRADYRSRIERAGFAQLVRDLEEKIEELSKE